MKNPEVQKIPDIKKKNLHVSYKSQHQAKKYGCPQRRIWMF